MRLISVSMMCAVLLGTSGCGEKSTRVPVAGKVMIDGNPLTLGTIQFVPKSGRPVASKILTDGSFRLTELSLEGRSSMTGVPPGKYQISVSASEVLDEDTDDVHWYVPARYADFRTSGLEVEVNGPNEELLIELTWEGAEDQEQAGRDAERVENKEEESEKDGDHANAATKATDEDIPAKTEAIQEE